MIFNADQMPICFRVHPNIYDPKEREQLKTTFVYAAGELTWREEGVLLGAEDQIFNKLRYGGYHHFAAIWI